MGFTKTFAVDNTAFVTITANTYCRKIMVFENDLAGTADYLAASPVGSATPVTQPAGTSFVFTDIGGFGPGDTPGAIKAVTGSMTFAQVEMNE